MQLFHSTVFLATASLGTAVGSLLAAPEPPPVPSASETEQNGYLRAGRDTVALLRELTDVLNSVQDRESADAAIPRVQEISEKLQDLRRRTRALPKLDPEQEAMCKKNLGDYEARTAVQGLMIALLNLAQTQAYGSEALLDTLQQLVSDGKL